MEYPKISIITPTFNRIEFLEECIISVISQKYPNLEFIICDGGSENEQLFELFEKFAESKDIHVIWYYQKNDEEMEEAGAELLDLVEISYELKEV